MRLVPSVDAHAAVEQAVTGAATQEAMPTVTYLRHPLSQASRKDMSIVFVDIIGLPLVDSADSSVNRTSNRKLGPISYK